MDSRLTLCSINNLSLEDLVNALANSQVPNGSLKMARQPTNVDMTPYFANSVLC